MLVSTWFVLWTQQEGATPLHVACETGNDAVVQTLVNLGAGVNAALAVRRANLCPPFALS